MSTSFVQVQGVQFVCDGKPYRFAGANCYYLPQRLANESTAHEVIEMLDAARELGLTVIRTWAFNDGDGWNALQTSPGCYNEEVFKALDRLLEECRARGLRLMPTLSNYWKEYGGMQQYARWSSGKPDASSEMFYRDAAARQMFLKFVADVLQRTNHITGVQYKDDPTIIAWDIANEPRCANDSSAKTISVWVDDVARFIKGVDSNHLVTFGCEGFFGPSQPEYLSSNPYDAAHEGGDFISEFRSPALDFTCIHMWHNQWIPQASAASRLKEGKKWIEAHEKASREILKKPLVIQEFGCKAESAKERPEWYKMVYKAVEASWSGSGTIAGSCMWMLAACSYPDYDGYTLHLSTDGQKDSNGDANTLAVIKQHAAKAMV